MSEEIFNDFSTLSHGHLLCNIAYLAKVAD